MAKLSYTDSGVDYGRLDAFKRACQLAGLSPESSTAESSTVKSSAPKLSTPLGESASLIELDNSFLAHVEEGLGTKHLVADAMFALTGACHYRSIGIDLVAAIVNDLVATGAMPVSVAMHVSAGSGAWFADETRSKELIDGFAQGCRSGGATWGGGETATLKDVVSESSVVLSGSAVGIIQPKSKRIAPSIKDRDAILFIASSGIHANGLTLVREVSGRLPDGYLTKLADGRTFGEALLTPSAIYVELIHQCQIEKIDLHYAIPITGHGWRKLMRADEPFVYRIDVVRDPTPEFKLMIDQNFIDEAEAYATFNMGAGFALMVDEADVSKVIDVARRSNYNAWRAGTVIKNGSEKAVEIAPLGIRYAADSLRLR